MRSICRYKQGVVLAGVLYFHRISDFWMTGVSKKNLVMFQQLCGERALQNVVIVTNMWEEVHPLIGNTREANLMRDSKPILDRGAKMARHDNTISSAQTIIRLLLNNHPLPLRIQEELVDGGKDVSETAASWELSLELAVQRDTRVSPEIAIVFVSQCILFGRACYSRASHIFNLTSRQSPTIYQSPDSVMGATGTGKSTVRWFQLGRALSKKLTSFYTRPCHGLNSS
jgi:hypothetical protein